ncbi:carboxymuconolactone decarboxylase family protein [Lysobacter korlensis]|uniref:Carboxymuconolactone decarboxylase family protein n=1 Tax=Lysobacter korlensis TaxID=553636 RepID=A0ABV6RX24_9GAMM
MTRLERLRPERLNEEQRALYDSIAGGPRAQGPQHFALTAPDGSLNGPFNALLLSPPLGEALQSVGAAVRYRTTLTPRVREAAILLVAAAWDSAFERMAHESVGRSVGLTEEELSALAGGSVPATIDEQELPFLEVTQALLRGDLTDEEWEHAVARICEAAVFELSTLVGYYATLALQLRVFRVDPPERRANTMEDHNDE